MYKLVKDKTTKLFMVLELDIPIVKPHKTKRIGNRGYFNNQGKRRR